MSTISSRGLFIIILSLGAAVFAVWLSRSGHRDDVLYRIHFAESVSGMALGDPVKFRGVDVGTVKAMMIDAADPRLVEVDVKLRKETPVKTDTRASLKLKGITGVVFIELSGGSPEAQSLVDATPTGQIPEIRPAKRRPQRDARAAAESDREGLVAGGSGEEGVVRRRCVDRQAQGQPVAAAAAAKGRTEGNEGCSLTGDAGARACRASSSVRRGECAFERLACRLGSVVIRG